MALPALFQRLVDDGGWVVICSEELGQEDRYVIGNSLLQFSSDRAKDADRQFYVAEAGNLRTAWGKMDPRGLADKMGEAIDDEFEAFEFIAKNSTGAVSKLRKFRLRRLFLEPLMLMPIVPLLILALIPPIRMSVLGIVAWWTEGPVKRLVY